MAVNAYIRIDFTNSPNTYLIQNPGDEVKLKYNWILEPKGALAVITNGVGRPFIHDPNITNVDWHPYTP